MSKEEKLRLSVPETTHIFQELRPENLGSVPKLCTWSVVFADVSFGSGIKELFPYVAACPGGLSDSSAGEDLLHGSPLRAGRGSRVFLGPESLYVSSVFYKDGL